ncbi:MAG: tandem-95 repeat protein [Deltaproteobacteria bacterium]|nr:MAG: tandem-95 repeat protein [Deltaproteobacteria bacterium]
MLPRTIRALVAVAALVSVPGTAAHAETVVTPTSDVAALVDAFAGAGIHVVNATLESGSVSQAGPSYNNLTLPPQGSTGTFVEGPLAIARGALLTSGDVQLALPPNATVAGSLDGATGIHGADALDDDPFCDTVIGNASYPSRDVVRLTLDFTLDPGFDGVEVTYVFGSEEYPDYLASLYADAFGIFVRAAGTDAYENIGLDEDGRPVNINGPYFASDHVISTVPGVGDTGLSGYNGLTPRITNAKGLPAGPEYVHQLVVVVCDATDRYLDSGLFVASIAGCAGSACAAARYCGDGTVDPGELCDDGNNVDTDGCTNACSPCADTLPGAGIDRGCTAVEPICASFGGDLSDCTRCDDDTVGDVDSGCGAPTPACFRDGLGVGLCVECTSDADCVTGCDLATHTCAACIDDTAAGVDTGCDAEAPACDADAAGGPVCVPCTADPQCGEEVCTADLVCSACEDTASELNVDHGCSAVAPLCQSSGSTEARCVPCVDDSVDGTDLGCNAITPSCDESGAFGPVCLGCETTAECGPGKVCTPGGACVPCYDSATGAGQDLGCPSVAPICADSGKPTAYCTPCMDDRTSSVDTGCNSTAPACDESAPGAPVCVGCTLDSQCGVGAICDTRQRCVVCEDTAVGSGLDDGCGFSAPICAASGTVNARCVPCEDNTVVGTDRGCAAPTPACDAGAVNGPKCVGCTGNGQCSVGTICTSAQICRPCEDTLAGASVDDGCVSAKPICTQSGTSLAHCVPCVDDKTTGIDTGCGAALPACDPSAPGGPTCVACTRSEECNGKVCSSGRLCVPCEDTALASAVDLGCDLGVAICVGSGLPTAHCVPCVDDTVAGVDSGCFGGLPACDVSASTCVGCTRLEQCAPDGICGAHGACVACEDTALGAVRDSGCTLAQPLCVGAGTDTARCAPCMDDTDGGVDTGCAFGVPNCLEIGGGDVACFPCITNDDCAFGEFCNDAHACELIPNAPPLAVDDLVEVDEDGAVLVAPLANDFDPEGETLTVSDVLVAAPRAGEAEVRADGSVLYTPRADRHGPDALAYEVCDADGACETAYIYVLVRPQEDAPVAVDDHVATAANQLVAIGVLLNDYDPDGDALVLDGSTAPEHGTTAPGADDKLLYSPETGFVGEDSFSYTVRDGAGNTATATVTITVGGPAGPTAVDDAGAVDEDGEVVIDVLGNDTGDTLTVGTVGVAIHGTAEVAEGGVRYVPDADFAGEDGFAYTACDAAGACASARVTVTVAAVPDPPLALDDVTSAVGELSFDPTSNDVDADGGAPRVTSITSPWRGEATLGDDGLITYTPPVGFIGIDVMSYTVEDAEGASATAWVALDVRATPNTAPLAAADAFIVDDGAASDLDVLANDSDGDALAVVAVQEPRRGFVSFGDGVLVYHPDHGFCGEVSFGYTVSDAGGAASSATVTLAVGDRDEDGLCNLYEVGIGSDPDDPDSDDDGLSDAEEDAGTSSPIDADSDDDGVADGVEVDAGLDPADPDSDDDGLSDGLERGAKAPIPGGTSDGDHPITFLGTDAAAAAWQPDTDASTITDPLDADTDDDGLLDGTEDADHDGAVGDGETDPNAIDTDEDGLLDGTESGLAAPEREDATDMTVFVPDSDPTTTTDPTDADTDDGGVIDGEEDVNGNGAVDEGERDPLVAEDDVPKTNTSKQGGCGGSAPAGPLSAVAGLLVAAWLVTRRRRIAS